MSDKGEAMQKPYLARAPEDPMKTDLRETLEVCADLMDALSGMDEGRLLSLYGIVSPSTDDFDCAIIKLWQLANQPEAFTTKHDFWPVLTWDEHPHQFMNAVENILVGRGCSEEMLVWRNGDATPFWHADKHTWFAPEPDDTPLQVAQRIARPFKGEPWADKVLALVIDVTTGQPVSPRGA